MCFASKTAENIEFLFSKKSQKTKKLGTIRKFKEKSDMLYQRKREHVPLLVQLTPLNFGLSSYPFACQ